MVVLGEGAVGAGVDGGVVPVCGAAVGEVWDCSVVAGGEVEMGGGVRVGTGVGPGGGVEFGGSGMLRDGLRMRWPVGLWGDNQGGGIPSGIRV